MGHDLHHSLSLVVCIFIFLSKKKGLNFDVFVCENIIGGFIV